MSPKELKALVKTMRSLGVTHFKEGDVELELSPEVPMKQPRRSKKSLEEEKEIKHKVEQLASVMSLGDEELLDRLFPDKTFEDDNGLHS